MADTDLTKTEAIQKLQYARNLVKRARDKSLEVVQQAKTTVETAGTALFLGYWYGSTEEENPDFEQMGIPVDLGLAFLAHGLAFSGVAKGGEDDLHAVGNGALAHYAARMGTTMGRESLLDEDAPPVEAGVAGVGYQRRNMPPPRQARPSSPFEAAWGRAA